MTKHKSREQKHHTKIWTYSIALSIGIMGLSGINPDETTFTAIAQTIAPSANPIADQLQQRGMIEYNSGQPQIALETWKKALILYQRANESGRMAGTLGMMGSASRAIGNYNNAIIYHKQALDLWRLVGDQSGEATTLSNLGNVYKPLGRYEEAIEVYQRSQELQRKLRDRDGEANALGGLGSIYEAKGDYNNAIAAHEAQLNIIRERQTQKLDPSLQRSIQQGEASALGSIGLVYKAQGNWEKAITYYQQSLKIAQTIGNESFQATSLANLGNVYRNMGNYATAIDYHEKSLQIAQKTSNPKIIAEAYGGLGNDYMLLGDYSKALFYQLKNRDLTKSINNRRGELSALANIGTIYQITGEYRNALKFHEIALAIAKAIGDRNYEGSALGGIGNSLYKLGNYQQALEIYQEQLNIASDIGDRNGKSLSLGNSANVYLALKNYSKAQELSQQALEISRVLKNRAGEAIALNNLGAIFSEQGQTDFAIIFYKQAVDTYESIRLDIQTLSPDQQQIYIKSVEDTYRRLADALLSQSRILEAQRVLELLKLQELRNYNRDTRSFFVGTQMIYTSLEREVIGKFGSLTALGQAVHECEVEKCPQLSALKKQQQNLNGQYDQYIKFISLDIEKSRKNDSVFSDPNTLSANSGRVVNAQQRTMLVYPFVLEKKLWLLWIGPNGISNRVEVYVSQKDLSLAVTEFRTHLENPSSDIKKLKASSNKLYNWLIKPLESEIKENNIKNIIFAQDRVIRYVPMAALFDGEKYLVEKYSTSTILSAELTDVDDKFSKTGGVSTSPTLGLGVSKATSKLSALPNVPQELQTIINDISDISKGSSKPPSQGLFTGKIFLDEKFTFATLSKDLANYRILHIATHAQFIPYAPQDSYLLMGNNERLMIPAINKIAGLNNIRLVVLSACETALSGADKQGLELASLGYYFMITPGQAGGTSTVLQPAKPNRAKAVLASLWAVSDDGTQKLMTAFYNKLAEKPITKSAALSEAQRAMIINNKALLTPKRGPIDWGTGEPPTSTTMQTDSSHPYYWAPFILIGNGQ
jgi:CHAT domain-containing protein/lipopolysaccharide biosynthesis regulator YciM